MSLAASCEPLPQRPGWRDPWPWLLALLALGLRWLDLGHRLLWADEAATWYFGDLIVGGRLGEAMLFEPTPPLFYALAGWSERLWGPGDVALRVPSVVFGTFGVVAAWWLGRRLFPGRHGEVTGRIAGLLVAIHPLLVLYGREARVYPLLALEVLLLVGVLHRALDGGSVRRWAAVAGLGALVCYSHFYGLFVIGTIGLAALLLARTRRDRLHGVGASLAGGLAFAPYVLATLPSLRRSGADWSVAMIYQLMPGERSPLRVLEGQAIGGLRTFFSRHLAQPPSPPFVRWPSLAAQGLLIAPAIAVPIADGWRRLRDRAGSRPLARLRAAWDGVLGEPAARSVTLVGLFWLVPIAVPWTITHGFGRPIFHNGRHDAFVVPLACVLLGYGASRLWHGRGWRRGLVVGCLSLLVLSAALRVMLLHTAGEDRRVLEIAEVLRTEAAPEDRVIAFGIRRLVTERYLRLANGQVPIASFPASTDDHPGWSDLLTLAEDVPALEREAEERVAELTVAGGRVFLLTRFPGTREAPSRSIIVDGPLMRALAAAGWRRVARWPTLELEVWDRAASEPAGSPPAGGSPAESVSR